MIDDTTDTRAVTRETKAPNVPEWVDLVNLSSRANDLMWQNAELINQAADLLNAGDFSPLAWEELQDIWAETVHIEAEYRDEMNHSNFDISMDRLSSLLPQFDDLVARAKKRAERGL